MKKGSFVFAGCARLEVRWTGTALPVLEHELVAHFAKYGLELTGSAYDQIAREWALVFHPVLEETEDAG